MSTKKKSHHAPKKVNGKTTVFNALHALGCPVEFEFVSSADGMDCNTHPEDVWEQLNRSYTLTELHNICSKIVFVNCADTFTLVSGKGAALKFAKGKRLTRRCTPHHMDLNVLGGVTKPAPEAPAAKPSCAACGGHDSV